jgi:hypothetical protein
VGEFYIEFLTFGELIKLGRKYTTLVSRVPEYIVVLVTSNFRYFASAPKVPDTFGLLTLGCFCYALGHF